MAASLLERLGQPHLPEGARGKMRRRLYVACAATLFLGGTALSVVNLDLRLAQLNWTAFGVNTFLGAPIAIGLNALGLIVAGSIVGSRLDYRGAFRACSVAHVANVLPIPAGMVVHSAALAKGGASLLTSGGVVLLGNLASVSIIIGLVGGGVLALDPIAGTVLATTGVAGVCVCAAVSYAKAGWWLSSGFLLVRAIRIAVMILRIKLSFWVLSADLTLLEGAVYAGAAVLGTTVAVFPSGLGLSESIAAVASTVIGTDPAVAFTAVALNRLSTLLFAGLVTLRALRRQRTIEINGCK